MSRVPFMQTVVSLRLRSSKQSSVCSEVCCSGSTTRRQSQLHKPSHFRATSAFSSDPCLDKVLHPSRPPEVLQNTAFVFAPASVPLSALTAGAFVQGPLSTECAAHHAYPSVVSAIQNMTNRARATPKSQLVFHKRRHVRHRMTFPLKPAPTPCSRPMRLQAVPHSVHSCRHPMSNHLPPSARTCAFSAFALSRSSSLSRHPEIPVFVPGLSRLREVFLTPHTRCANRSRHSTTISEGWPGFCLGCIQFWLSFVSITPLSAMLPWYSSMDCQPNDMRRSLASGSLDGPGSYVHVDLDAVRTYQVLTLFVCLAL